MTALMKTPPASLGVLRPNSIQELDIFSQRAATSGMVPQQYVDKPGAIFIAIQYGSELGLSPMQSLTCIAVVNNRATVFGDALPGLCRQSPHCEDIKEWFEGEGDSLTAWCEAKRRGASPVRQSFSVSDAKKANLWGKGGPWSQYPRRMLTWRARSWALRDAFPDVLRGLISYEEEIDTPAAGRQSWSGPTIDASPVPPPGEAAHTDLRSAINAEVPLSAAPPKRRTARQWLDELNQRVAACATTEALDEIATSAEVRRAQEHLKNGALEELNGLFADAMQRLADAPDRPAGDPDGPLPVEADDIFPGDRP
jgi:hypothetical protein